ncbi:MAG: serine--tRNA ligase [Rickettsiaceae bacterium]
MLGIKWIRENIEQFDELLKLRGLDACSKEITDLDEEKRRVINLMHQFQHAKKKKSEMLANMQLPTSKEYDEIKRDIDHINEKLEELSNTLNNNNKLKTILENLPNIPSPDVHYGLNEEANKLIRHWGSVNESLNAKSHFEMGTALNLMDFAQTAKTSGSRFVTLKGSLAKLERALINFMLDIHTQEFNFLEVSPPALVKPHAMYNAGLLPKFATDSFVTTNGYRLIPTAEVPLINMVADTIVPREDLPIRYVAYTPCFRSEAGSAGKDTRGMIRMHQFGKVELVSIATPDESQNEHEYILNAAEEVLKRLELPYRVMLLCIGEMGFQAAKTYDIEVWMPFQKKYREISSCSNCTDFQTRRMKARYKEFGKAETTLLHTLNGSGLPIGRTMVAIIENYQNSDGSINVPDALVSYMGGQRKI